jgi:raffinose/stachyose/melibiose transport system substrate-binding protein
MGEVDGELRAVPLDASFAVFWYDRNLFDRLGLQPPRTWPDLLDACEALRADGRVPIALGNSGRWPVLLFYGYLLARLDLRNTLNRAVTGTTGDGLDDPRFTRAWAMVKELLDAGAFPENAQAMTNLEARTMFFEGEAGMYLGTTTTGLVCREAYPEMLPRLDCFPFPAVEAEDADSSMAFLGTSRMNMVLWDGSPYTAQAAELLNAVACAPVAEALANSGKVPTWEGGWDESTMPEPTRRAMDLLTERGTDIQIYLDIYLIPSIAQTMLQQGESILTGSTTPEAAATALEEQVQRVVRARLQPPIRR